MRKILNAYFLEDYELISKNIPRVILRAQMPEGTEILTAFFNQQLTVTGLEPTYGSSEERYFYAARVGEEIPGIIKEAKFITATTSPDGTLWHIFEVLIETFQNN